MEPIRKPELDKHGIHVPLDMKCLLENGKITTYDAFQLMANAVNGNIVEVHNATDWVNENGKILAENEEERIAQELAREASEIRRKQIFEQNEGTSEDFGGESRWGIFNANENERNQNFNANETARNNAEDDRKRRFDDIEQDAKEAFELTEAAASAVDFVLNGRDAETQFPVRMTHYAVKHEEGDSEDVFTVEYKERNANFLTRFVSLEENWSVNLRPTGGNGITVTLYRVLGGSEENPDNVTTGTKLQRMSVQTTSAANPFFEHTVVTKGNYLFTLSDGENYIIEPNKENIEHPVDHPVAALLIVNNAGLKGLQKAVSDIDNLLANVNSRVERLDGLNVIRTEGASGSAIREQWQLCVGDEDNPEPIGAPITTYKDQTIRRVTYDQETQVLTIVYIKEHGEEEPVNIDMSNMIIESEFGDGLKVVNHKVSLKLATDGESHNYLHIDAAGNLSVHGLEAYFNRNEGVHKESGEYDTNTRWGIFDHNEEQRQAEFAGHIEDINEATEVVLQEHEKLVEVEGEVNDLAQKTKDIEHETTEETVSEVDFYNDDKTERLHHIGDDGADFKNLKSNGKDVLTEHQDISGLATKEDVEKAKVNEISSETTEDSDSSVVITTDDDEPVAEMHAEIVDDEEECQSWNSDDYNGKGKGEQYAKITPAGIFAKGYFDRDGNPIGGDKANAVSIIVKKDGSGDFANIVAAVDSINNEDNSKKLYNIYVYEGTYDMVSDFFGARGVDYHDSYLEGLKLPNNVNIIGVGARDKVILKGELPSDTKLRTSIAWSTIYLKGRNNRLENLTITNYNGRYPVHDQAALSDMSEYKHEYINCVFIHKGYDAGATIAYSVDATNNDTNHRWGSTHPFGQGTTNKATTFCKYCVFENQSASGDCFLSHDDKQVNNACSNIILDCCTFKSDKNVLIELSSLGAGYENNLELKNCKSLLTNGIISVVRSQSTTIEGECNWMLYGNKPANVTVTIPNENNNNLI